MTGVVVGAEKRLYFRADSARREIGPREYETLLRDVRRGAARLFPRREVMDFVKAAGRWQGVILRNLVTGWLERAAGSIVLDADPVVLWRMYKRGAALAFKEGKPTIPGTGQGDAGQVPTDAEEFREAEAAVSNRLRKLLAVNGSRSSAEFLRELDGLLGQAPSPEALSRAQALRERFWREVRVPGSVESFNQELEDAARTADLLELGELRIRDGFGSGGGSWQYRGERREPLEARP